MANPILNSLKGIELGAEFRDLLYNRDIQGDLKFEVHNDLNYILKVQINNDILNNSPIVSKWEYFENDELKCDGVANALMGYRYADGGGVFNQWQLLPDKVVVSNDFFG